MVVKLPLNVTSSGLKLNCESPGGTLVMIYKTKTPDASVFCFLSLHLFRTRWERAAGEVRPDLERDSAPPEHASRERREPGAGLQNPEAAFGGAGTTEPDVPHRAGLAGDPGGERQSQGHRFKSASVLPRGHGSRKRLDDDSD